MSDRFEQQQQQQQQQTESSRIFVCVRMRPLVPLDLAASNKPEGCVLFKPDGQTVQVNQDRFHQKQFHPDRTFDAPATQHEVYRQSLRYLVHDLLQHGHNGTGIMYGQTGSGKTYTMFGQGSSTSNNGNNKHNRSRGFVSLYIRRHCRRHHCCWWWWWW